MAGSNRAMTGTLPRLLQEGIDLIIKHDSLKYVGPYSQIFTELKTDKAFFEAVQLAGVGMANIKGESAPVSYDSVDQNWVYRYPVQTFEKAARFSMEALEDNLYENLISLYGKEIAKALEHNKDFRAATILNEAFTTTGPDGKSLCASDHPIQAGGTLDNTLALDLSEDAIEQAVIKVDNFVTPDGLVCDVQTMNLIVPTSLRFEADRLVNSKYRPGSMDNDISAINNQSIIKKIITWKRLTDSDGWFITTNAENGLLYVNKRGVRVEPAFKDPTTLDTMVAATERFVMAFADPRCIIGSQGA